MQMAKIRIFLALAFLATAVGLCSANAQDLLNQDWVLDPTRSQVYLQTEKLDAVIERHQFTVVEGKKARVKSWASARLS
jgi:hypothetical protein